MALNRADFYDAELRRYNEHFRAAVNARSRDRVLDIGCGAGQTTREAARAAATGTCSAWTYPKSYCKWLAVAVPRKACVTCGSNWVMRKSIRFNPDISICASADPIAAFANICRAMRPGARLVLLVWQSCDRNEWATTISGCARC